MFIRLIPADVVTLVSRERLDETNREYPLALTDDSRGQRSGQQQAMAKASMSMTTVLESRCV